MRHEIPCTGVACTASRRRIDLRAQTFEQVLQALEFSAGILDLSRHRSDRTERRIGDSRHMHQLVTRLRRFDREGITAMIFSRGIETGDVACEQLRIIRCFMDVIHFRFKALTEVFQTRTILIDVLDGVDRRSFTHSLTQPLVDCGVALHQRVNRFQASKLTSELLQLRGVVRREEDQRLRAWQTREELALHAKRHRVEDFSRFLSTHPCVFQ